jgi:hypothetical protein
MDEQTRAEAIERKDAVYRWRHIFEILGLDSAKPLYPALGLNPEHATSWRAAARVFLTHYHTHIDQCDWDDWQWDSWDIDTGEAWVRAALDDATRREGVVAAQALYAWGMGTFVWKDTPPDYSFMWGRILGNLGSTRRAGAPPTGLSPATQAQLEAAVTRYLEPSTHDLIDDADQPPRSDWDVHIHRYYAMSMGDPDGDHSPLERASNSIEYRRMRDLWAALRQFLTPDDFQRLLLWGMTVTHPNMLGTYPISLPPW